MHTYNHILFTRSSFDGYSSYFHLLTIVNDAAINVCIQAPPPHFYLGGGSYPEVELLDYRVILYLISWCLPYCVYGLAMHKASKFSTSSPTLPFCFGLLKKIAILMNVRWYLIVISNRQVLSTYLDPDLSYVTVSIYRVHCLNSSKGAGDKTNLKWTFPGTEPFQALSPWILRISLR